MRPSAALGALLAVWTFSFAHSSRADTESWATIDATGSTPKLEAGQQFYVSIARLGANGPTEFTVNKAVKAIVATCIPQAGGYDVGDCIALVKRDPGQKKFLVSPRGLISETGSSGVFYALAPNVIPARFTVIVYTE